MILFTMKGKTFSWKNMLRAGDMPSGHTALVAALSMILLLKEGLSSAFFVSIVFLGIVIRDALGVRRTAGENAQRINEIITKQKIKMPLKDGANGHKMLEVIAGAIVGVVCALAVFILL